MGLGEKKLFGVEGCVVCGYMLTFGFIGTINIIFRNEFLNSESVMDQVLDMVIMQDEEFHFLFFMIGLYFLWNV